MALVTADFDQSFAMKFLLVWKMLEMAASNDLKGGGGQSVGKVIRIKVCVL